MEVNGMALEYPEKAREFITRSAPFLAWLKEWESSLKAISLEDLVDASGGPENFAIASVDVVKGFCVKGPLASPRVGRIVKPIVSLVKKAYDLGVRKFVFTQDTHPKDSPEFREFGPHCVEGSSESEMVDELSSLPFARIFEVIPKRSIDSFLGTGLEDWLKAHNNLRMVLVVGDCTDLCVYRLAMYLKLRANVMKSDHRVVVPVRAVETYDLPVEAARSADLLPHDGDLLHLIFLYHMRLNGIEVVDVLL